MQDSEASSWDADIRAPLIVAILRAYRAVSEVAWKQELR
jgi:hypothetical protein